MFTVCIENVGNHRIFYYPINSMLYPPMKCTFSKGNNIKYPSKLFQIQLDDNFDAFLDSKYSNYKHLVIEMVNYVTTDA